jgi:hypothetical protein
MSDPVFEVGTSELVTAWHVMPGMDGPEGELHSHDYRIDVVVAREELDEQDMVCDLDVLRAALSAATAQVRDKNLEIISPRGPQPSPSRSSPAGFTTSCARRSSRAAVEGRCTFGCGRPPTRSVAIPAS